MSVHPSHQPWGLSEHFQTDREHRKMFCSGFSEQVFNMKPIWHLVLVCKVSMTETNLHGCRAHHESPCWSERGWYTPSHPGCAQHPAAYPQLAWQRSQCSSALITWINDRREWGVTDCSTELNINYIKIQELGQDLQSELWPNLQSHLSQSFSENLLQLIYNRFSQIH